MRVQVHIVNSEGMQVVVFDEVVREFSQIDHVTDITTKALELEQTLAKFVESMGEDP